MMNNSNNTANVLEEIPGVEMEDVECIERKWEDMDIDILVRVFQSFSIFELTSGIAEVCHTWRLAACDSLLWKSLDLSVLRSDFIKIPLEPYVYVSCESDKQLTKILRISLNLSRGSILTLVFHYNLYVSNDQLVYTAERCPKLQRLVMPAWNRIRKAGIVNAIQCWEDLESLSMPFIANPPYLFKEISNKCKKFSELKVMGQFDDLFASTLVEYIPKLKVLSLRCSMVSKDALLIILENMKYLQVLNISHCIFYEVGPPPARNKMFTSLDDTIIEKAARLPRFVTCESNTCIMCQRTRRDDGMIRWYKYEEECWRMDEVESLAI